MLLSFSCAKVGPNPSRCSEIMEKISILINHHGDDDLVDHDWHVSGLKHHLA
jgi:hypothetical protein